MAYYGRWWQLLQVEEARQAAELARSLEEQNVALVQEVTDRGTVLRKTAVAVRDRCFTDRRDVVVAQVKKLRREAAAGEALKGKHATLLLEVGG
jgi:hypoxanthine-guanine phosphoribosyltransferase